MRPGAASCHTGGSDNISQPGLKRLLLVSPGFAPANTADSHRARLSLPHWKDLGWEAEVLAVRGSDVEAPQEPELLETIPSGTPVHRVRAWPLPLARRLGFGTLSWRALGAIRRTGDRVLAQRKFDLVFFSTSQFGLFPLGPRWLRTAGVPYALDFQDPWVTAYYEQPGAPRPPGGWKYRLARRKALRAEPGCLRAAAGVVSVSARYLDDFEARYPWFDRSRACELPFSAADTDFARLRVEAPGHTPTLAQDRRHLVAVGAVGPYMRRSLEALFRAVARIHREGPAAPRLQIHFIGTSYAATGPESVAPLARHAGIAEGVDEHPRRIPYLDALRWMLAADALLVLGSDDPGYVPSRLANLLWAEKPVLAVAEPSSALASRLNEWGQAAALVPDDDSLRRWLLRFLTPDPPAFSPPSPRWRDLHSSGGMTRRLAEFFGECLARVASRPRSAP